MSGSITSSENPPVSKGARSRSWIAVGLRAGIEGILAAGAAGAAVALVLPQRELIVVGVACAWAGCTIGTFGLAYGQCKSPAAFWRAFGLGMALRVGLLVVLAAKAWSRPVADAAALLGAYVVGLTAIMLLEFRHLVRDLGVKR